MKHFVMCCPKYRKQRSVFFSRLRKGLKEWQLFAFTLEDVLYPYNMLGDGFDFDLKMIRIDILVAQKQQNKYYLIYITTTLFLKENPFIKLFKDFLNNKEITRLTFSSTQSIKIFNKSSVNGKRICLKSQGFSDVKTLFKDQVKFKKG